VRVFPEVRRGPAIFTGSPDAAAIVILTIMTVSATTGASNFHAKVRDYVSPMASHSTAQRASTCACRVGLAGS
jgi:hypothetical protein